MKAWREAGARGTWFFLVVGAVIGLALGILVSVITDVPFAPELGLVLGALVGWLSRRAST
jgi:large-conductance mechanosensitive channel